VECTKLRTVPYFHNDGIELTKNKIIKKGEEVLLNPWYIIMVEENK
jgi:hypothetical protein